MRLLLIIMCSLLIGIGIGINLQYYHFCRSEQTEFGYTIPGLTNTGWHIVYGKKQVYYVKDCFRLHITE
jgi:hypothetical protein